MPKPTLRNHFNITGGFLLGLVCYVAFALAYYFLVLLFLRGWLKQLFDDHKIYYAALVLPLIVGQAVLLDCVTIGLRKFGWLGEK